MPVPDKVRRQYSTAENGLQTEKGGREREGEEVCLLATAFL